MQGGKSCYALSSYLSPFLEVSLVTIVVQTMDFPAKLPSHCILKSRRMVINFPTFNGKIMQHGF